jgi:uncharacterized protein (DUF736 family)
MNNDGAEIGAGWKRTGEKAGDYVSLQIDDPTFGIRSAPTSSSPMRRQAAWGCTGTARPSACERD